MRWQRGDDSTTAEAWAHALPAPGGVLSLVCPRAQWPPIRLLLFLFLLLLTVTSSFWAPGICGLGTC